MITFSIIQKSKLEGALRLDAEYYQPEYLDLISKIKSQKSKFIEEIGQVAYGTTPQGGVFEEKGIPFVRSQNFSNNLIDTSDLVFCTEKFHNQNKKSAIKSGDILFAAVGATIGDLAIVQDEIKEGNTNQNIARVRITEEIFNPYFVGLFFASKFGQFQIERLTTGNAQPYLNSEQIKSLLVPSLDKQKQDEIGNYYSKIQKELENSQTLYSQAENLLLEELGLKNFKANEDLYNIVNFSDLESLNRIDAEYYQTIYEKLESRIRNHGFKILEDIIENVPAKFDAGKQLNNNFKYVELSNINASIGTVDGFSEVLGKEAPSRAKRVLKMNDVIVSSVEGSLEKVALVHSEQEGYLASTGFFQFRSKEILPEVLLILAKSLVFQKQLERQCAGTILTAVPKEAVKNVLVPILPKDIQKKIAELVRKSHEARKKAKELLEEAKLKVEEMIEKQK